MPSNYQRRCPDRAPHGSNKAALFALKPGASLIVTTQRAADVFTTTARMLGLRLVQRALHPYARQTPGLPPPPRRYLLTLAD